MSELGVGMLRLLMDISASLLSRGEEVVQHY
jgi:hypothetical protein